MSAATFRGSEEPTASVRKLPGASTRLSELPKW
jgi:hypothetical protein